MTSMIQGYNIVAVNTRFYHPLYTPEDSFAHELRIENAVIILRPLGSITPVYTICGEIYIDGCIICPDCAHNGRVNGCGNKFITSHTSTPPSRHFEIKCSDGQSRYVDEIVSMELENGKIVELNWKVGGDDD